MDSELRDALEKLHAACVYRDAAVSVGCSEDQRSYALTQYIVAMTRANHELRRAHSAPLKDQP